LGDGVGGEGKLLQSHGTQQGFRSRVAEKDDGRQLCPINFHDGFHIRCAQ
jgi:hypothetical protein